MICFIINVIIFCVKIERDVVKAEMRSLSEMFDKQSIDSGK